MKYNKLLLPLLGLSIASPNLMAVDLKTEKAKLGYSIGVFMGGSLKRQGITDVDPKALAQAVKDVLSGAKLKLSTAQMKATLESSRKKLFAKRAVEAKKSKAAGEAFLAANKKKKGVKVLASGLQYQIMKVGKGPKPKATDKVTVHYHGTLINGKVFDSSVKRGTPASFPVNGVIKGWQEILPLMPTGSKWKVFVPSNLAYGPRRAGALIGPSSTLVFEIELISIAKPAKVAVPAKATKPLK
ncbi:FKBP-type peptidyl-prolyl cis-trans isomerase FklB [hydrothermal vent metagenome]|uniref:peptidylprolyl isomerase n=1 Tax=hydrothermal vent metagenome TaxID=652676 RepID=A0A3B0YPU2_9ZZZZ